MGAFTPTMAGVAGVAVESGSWMTSFPSPQLALRSRSADISDSGPSPLKGLSFVWKKGRVTVAPTSGGSLHLHCLRFFCSEVPGSQCSAVHHKQPKIAPS